MTIIFLYMEQVDLEVYLQVTVTLAYVRVVFRCFTVQMYRPVCSAVTLEMTRVAVPVLLCRSVSGPLCRYLLDGTSVQMTKDGGKLSTLQVRFRVSPSITVVFPAISVFLTSLRQHFDKILEFVRCNLYFSVTLRHFNMYFE